MRNFFKIFFASLLSLIVFSIICVVLIIAIVNALTSKSKPDISSGSVLTLDLGHDFHERAQSNPLSGISEEGEEPGLYDVVRLIRNAKTDKNIAGIYLKTDGNANGFASSNELRNALIDFRSSKKFVI